MRAPAGPWSPARLFRVLAVSEAVTWTLLLLGMVLKYLTRTTDLGVSVFGAAHGLVFLAYCAGTVVVGVDQQWGTRTLFFGLAAAVPPLLTVPFERWAGSRGLLRDRWRLREPAGHRPGAAERVVGAVVRRPLPSTLVTTGLVAAVFAGLLTVGPPTQWG